MPNTIVSPNMTITVPVVLTDPGPDWATRIYNALFSTIDAHDHSTGKGVQIAPPGLNINADLPFGTTNNATLLRSARFVNQGSPLALGPDVGCVYESGGELWYNDSSGRQVKLTSVGAVNSTLLALPFKLVTTTPFSILSTDLFEIYYVDLSAHAQTMNLPASSALAPGRVYYFADFKGFGQTNALTIAPNGTDKINAVNASIVVQVTGFVVAMTTDGAGNWTLVVDSPSPPAINPFLQSARGPITANFTIDSLGKDYVLLCDTSAGVFNLTMPAPTNGRMLVVVDVGNAQAVHNLTLVRHGAEKLNNTAGNMGLATNTSVHTIYSNGTDWWVARGNVA